MGSASEGRIGYVKPYRLLPMQSMDEFRATAPGARRIRSSFNARPPRLRHKHPLLYEASVSGGSSAMRHALRQLSQLIRGARSYGGPHSWAMNRVP